MGADVNANFPASVVFKSIPRQASVQQRWIYPTMSLHLFCQDKVVGAILNSSDTGVSSSCNGGRAGTKRSNADRPYQ